MPARDGTGPLGQGARTGRGMGNCKSAPANNDPAATSTIERPFHWGGRVWNKTCGWLREHRRSKRRAGG